MNTETNSASANSALEPGEIEGRAQPNRREFLAAMAGTAILAGAAAKDLVAQTDKNSVNLARVAVPSSFSTTSENKVSALNDGFAPADSFDRSHGVYALHGSQTVSGLNPWVQYEWNQPVSVNRFEVYWALERPRPGQIPGSGWPSLQVPQSYRILYWNGNDYVPVNQPQGLGVAADTFNATTFEPVKTSKVRLEVLPQQGHPAAILEWRVFNFGPVPMLPPVIDAGVDRSVMMGAKTYLAGKVTWLEDSSKNSARWVKTSGPGSVNFDDEAAPVTRANLSSPGDYVFQRGVPFRQEP